VRERTRGAALGIALFAKAPVAGMVKTRLVPPLSAEEAAQVARASLEHSVRVLVPAVPARWRLLLDGAPDPQILELARVFGLPILGQSEGDLGARLRAALGALRMSGASEVIAIGSDSPTLPPERLAQARDALERHDLVLGPAEDGGYYLIGLSRECDAVFEGIAWGTAGVAHETLDRARAAGLATSVLAPWYDVDDIPSLRRAALDLAASASRRASPVAGSPDSGSPLARTLDGICARLDGRARGITASA
jgi:uncharacterized protein